jgi:hypothetical protein
MACRFATQAAHAQQTRLPDYNEPPGGYDNPTGVVGGGSNNVGWACSPPATGNISYSDLDPNEDVEITFDYYSMGIYESSDSVSFTTNATGTGSSSVTFCGLSGSPPGDIKNASWSSDSGLSGTLPNLLSCADAC